MKKKILLIIVIITLFIVYLIIGNFTHLYIPCVFHKITGLYCPGCGMTRMLLSIFKLDFKKAFQYNQLLFILFPFIMILFIEYIYRWLTDKESIINKIPNFVWYILIVVLIIYGILRNIYVPLQPIV